MNDFADATATPSLPSPISMPCLQFLVPNSLSHVQEFLVGPQQFHRLGLAPDYLLTLSLEGE